VRDGRRAFAAGDPEGAASRLAEALALWYGRPLADVPPTPLVEAEAEAERLAELRLGAVELRITAELAGGLPAPRTPLGRPAAGGQGPLRAPARRSCRPISPTSPAATTR